MKQNNTRRTGVLLHLTSLPGRYSYGDMGVDAYHFVDFLRDCAISVWQLLPLNPPGTDLSPYQSISVHAGNTQLISLDLVADQGLLSVQDLTGNIEDCATFKQIKLKLAYENFKDKATESQQNAYQEFKKAHVYWLDNYALFLTLKERYNNLPWWDWQEQLRDRKPNVIAQYCIDLIEPIEQHKFEQFLFYQQWHNLKQYANKKGISLFGDIPIFIAHDSADVWANPKCFKLDKDGQPTVVAGVPPDYFSETGQRWGNPIFNWSYLKKTNYRWWIDRIRTQLELFDLIRIDHFRGFEAHWEIPVDEPTAMNGKWVKAPGFDFFKTMNEQFENLPLIAEDLGVITEEVTALRDQFNLPGMKILQFAFDSGPKNPYLPHNHLTNCVVYTGTHDNNTTLGWFTELRDDQKKQVYEYLGNPTEKMPWALIHTALSSIANLAIIPMQDILELDGEHRMNTPGTTKNNWKWRFCWDMVAANLPSKVKHLIFLHNRIVEDKFSETD